MRDEIDGRLWAEHHHQLGESVARFFVMIAEGLARLNAMRFEAPWRNQAGARRARPGHA